MFDYYYILLVIPALIVTVWAQYNVNSVFKKYSDVFCHAGLTGRDAAKMILDSNGLSDVAIAHIKGSMTDHYDPTNNTVSLSDTVDTVASVAAVGVAAHECGHAVQHATGYFPIKIRSAIIPATNFGSKLSMPMILIGLVLGWQPIAMIGVILYSLTVIFQLVTLPVEFDASGRAVKILEASGKLDSDELAGVRKVLRAAALTYVAALGMSLAQLIRLLAIVGGGNNRRRR